MLTIREAQMQVFRDRQLQEFTAGRLRDVADRFPRKYHELGVGGTMALIGAGGPQQSDGAVVQFQADNPKAIGLFDKITGDLIDLVKSFLPG